MELQKSETESFITPLKKVTPLSKYLAMILFIIMPFLGGWVGYRYAPEKVVEIEKVVQAPDTSFLKESDFLKSYNLCGKDFQMNDVYIDGVYLTEKLDELLRSPLQSPTTEEFKSSCDEFLSNVNDQTALAIEVTRSNYSFSEMSSVGQFDAYAVQFIPYQADSAIDVGFFVDRKSLDVSRIVVLDGSQGLRVGRLE